MVDNSEGLESIGVEEVGSWKLRDVEKKKEADHITLGDRHGIATIYSLTTLTPNAMQKSFRTPKIEMQKP